MRFPDSTSADTICEQLEPLVGRFGVTCQLGRAKAPFSVSADDPAVKALIDTYNEFTGKHAEPFAMGGGTYARNFARAVSFGPEETGLELPRGAVRCTAPTSAPTRSSSSKRSRSISWRS